MDAECVGFIACNHLLSKRNAIDRQQSDKIPLTFYDNENIIVFDSRLHRAFIGDEDVHVCVPKLFKFHAHCIKQ